MTTSEQNGDRCCRPRPLDNRIRRRWAPAWRELDLLGVVAGQTVADIGCGVGYFASETLQRIGPGGRLYLIDPDPVNLGRAKGRVGERPELTYLNSPGNRLDTMPSSSTDRVLLSLVLCCLVDKPGVMGETWRILKPGGRALVTYPRLRLKPRSRSLRVSAPIWRQLMSLTPWNAYAVKSSWWISRRLIEKPADRVPRHEEAPFRLPPHEEGRTSDSLTVTTDAR